MVCADWALDGAERVAKEITADGGRAIPFHVDVQSLEQTEAMAKAALDEYGTIDVMFANAGIAATGTAMDCEPEMWDRAIGVMLTGVWHSMRAALPTMVEKGSGSLINTASVGGIIGVPGIFPYAAAKAGVIGMTRQAAVEFGPKGIRVNAIAPGLRADAAGGRDLREGGRLGRHLRHDRGGPRERGEEVPDGQTGRARSTSPTSPCSSPATSRSGSPEPSASSTAASRSR